MLDRRAARLSHWDSVWTTPAALRKYYVTLLLCMHVPRPMTKIRFPRIETEYVSRFSSNSIFLIGSVRSPSSSGYETHPPSSLLH